MAAFRTRLSFGVGYSSVFSAQASPGLAKVGAAAANALSISGSRISQSFVEFRRSASIVASAQGPGASSSTADAAFLLSPAHHKGSHTLHPLREVDASTTEAPLPRMGLNEEERGLHNAARRNGFLTPSGRGCTDALRSLFYHSCQLDKRPYVAVDPHGNSIFVDTTAAMGKGKTRDFSTLPALLANIERELASGSCKGIQVVTTDSLAEQSKKLAIGALEGSNSFKSSPVRLSTTAAPGSSALSPSFYVFTGSKSQALAVAKVIARAAPPATKAKAALDSSTTSQERTKELQVKRARRVALMEKKLRKLITDPIAVKNLRVKAGVLDGFVRSSSAAPAATVPSSS